MSVRSVVSALTGLLLIVLCATAFAKFPLTKAFIVQPYEGPTPIGAVDLCVDIYNRVHLAWLREPLNPDDGAIHLYYRCFDANGKPLTDMIDLTPPLCGAGIFDVVSNSEGKVTIAAGVRLRDAQVYSHSYWRFDSLGQVPQRVLFGLDQDSVTISPQPKIAVGDSGQIAIALMNCSINNCDSVYYVMFDRNDQQLFRTRPASTAALELTSAYDIKLQMAPSGRFVIAWSANVLYPWPFLLSQPFARVFNADGSPRGEEILVACEGYPETCSGDSAYFLNGGAAGQFPDLAIQNNGDFVVAYALDFFSECSTQYYMMRRFYEDGTPKGPNVRISDKTVCAIWIEPTVRIRSDSLGNLLSVFLINTGWNQAHWNIWAQRFDSEGKPIGVNYRINDIPAKDPNGPIKFYSVDMNNAGLVAVAWWEVNALAHGWNLALQTMDISDICYKCGDANDDKVVDVSDAVYLISYIFSGGYAPKDLSLGDASGDGQIDISDAVALISYIFQGGGLPSECLGR
jgi:hypothetical protein